MPSSRVERAKALRAQRRSKTAATASGSGEEAIELSATSSIACLFLLMSIGASLATSFLMLYNPHCSLSPTESAVPTTTAAAVATASSNNYLRPPVDLSKVPPACTPEQLVTLSQQLPADHCLKDAPYTEKCSFTRATTQGCRDPLWIRNALAKAGNTNDIALIHVGYPEDADAWTDLVATAKHQPTKTACYQAIDYSAITTTTTNKKVHAWILETKQAAKARETFPDMTVEEVQPSQYAFGDQVTLSKWVESSSSQPKSNNNNNMPATIHVLKGAGYPAIIGAKAILNRVLYLEFPYHWQGDWKDYNLHTLMDRHLAKLGFVCYWHGADQNLWRINTGCWQDHYATKWWSNIACVNAAHPAANQVLDDMEAAFATTLTKTQVFGG